MTITESAHQFRSPILAAMLEAEGAAMLRKGIKAEQFTQNSEPYRAIFDEAQARMGAQRPGMWALMNATEQHRATLNFLRAD